MVRSTWDSYTLIMRTNNCKNQTQQIPAIANPPKKDVIIKAALVHLDGTESEIIMTVPKYTCDLEAYEDAQRLMTEYVNGLTRYWVKIERFQIQVGVMKDGLFEATLLGNPEEIPLNMLFEPGHSGSWITPAEAMSKRYVNESIEKGGEPC